MDKKTARDYIEKYNKSNFFRSKRVQLFARYIEGLASDETIFLWQDFLIFLYDQKYTISNLFHDKIPSFFKQLPCFNALKNLFRTLNETKLICSENYLTKENLIAICSHLDTISDLQDVISKYANLFLKYREQSVDENIAPQVFAFMCENTDKAKKLFLALFYLNYAGLATEANIIALQNQVHCAQILADSLSRLIELRPLGAGLGGCLTQDTFNKVISLCSDPDTAKTNINSYIIHLSVAIEKKISLDERVDYIAESNGMWMTPRSVSLPKQDGVSKQKRHSHST